MWRRDIVGRKLITCLKGNAADAMVGTTLCTGVIGRCITLNIIFSGLTGLGMQHSGIGGGGFMLVRDSEGNYEAIGELRLSDMERQC